MKKIIPLILVVILAFTSCSSVSLFKVDKINSKDLNTNINVKQISGSVNTFKCYNYLKTTAQKKLYKSIVKSSTQITSEKIHGKYLTKAIDVSAYNLTHKDIGMAIDAVICDYPQMFWIDFDYRYSMTNSVITDIQLYSVMSKDKCKKARKTFNNKINKLAKTFNKKTSDFERELAIHNYIIKNCSYSKSVNDTNYMPYTAYGAIVNKKAVCQGYVRAFQLLLTKAGIKNYTLVGVAQGDSHTWNCVKIQGKWYYVDPTWDDADNYSNFDYFNITTKQLKYDHKISKTYSKIGSKFVQGDSYNFVIPKCNTKTYNYYNLYACKVKSMSNNNIAKKLACAVEKHQKYFYIMVSSKLNYKIVYDQLFSDSVYSFANYIDDANSMVNQNQITKRVSIRQNKNLRIISIKLNYQ